MPDATLEDFEQMATAVIVGQSPILPRPEWGQDAAFVAHVVDRLRAEVDDLWHSLTQEGKDNHLRWVEAAEENEKLVVLVENLVRHGPEWCQDNLGEPYKSLLAGITEKTRA